MQAQQLDGRIGKSFTIKPDQFQAINPIIIVFVVPLFDFVIYPLFAKINLLKRPLQRMCVGLVFAIVSFIIAAILESRMQAAVSVANPANQIRVLNLSPCYVQLEGSISINMPTGGGTVQPSLIRINEIGFQAGQNRTSIPVNAFCQFGARNSTLTGRIDLTSVDLPKNLLIYVENDTIKSKMYSYDYQKNTIGYSLVTYDAFRVRSFEMLNIIIDNNNVKYNSTLDVKTLLQNSSLYVNSSYSSFDYADYELT